MKKILIITLVFFSFSINAQFKKYCVINNKGKYEIYLLDDGSHKGYFNLYDN